MSLSVWMRKQEEEQEAGHPSTERQEGLFAAGRFQMTAAAPARNRDVYEVGNPIKAANYCY